MLWDRPRVVGTGGMGLKVFDSWRVAVLMEKRTGRTGRRDM